MLKWLFKKWLDAFDRDYGYDSSYVREIIAADLDAAIRFARVMGLTKYRKGVPAEACFAAGLVGTMAEDCGPCTQLGVTMAERDGVAPEVIRAIVEGNTQAMSEDVLLAYRFAHAVLAHDPEADAFDSGSWRSGARRGSSRWGSRSRWPASSRRSSMRWVMDRRAAGSSSAAYPWR